MNCVLAFFIPGLRRTGKSCRLRWLNYLRPDVRRGNITAEEQLLILDLHSRWGNRWSKIAQHLPGRTDNEIKNYWRTRVQKHARHLRCDVNSASFRHVVRHVWMPRLRERVQADAGYGGRRRPWPSKLRRRPPRPARHPRVITTTEANTLCSSKARRRRAKLTTITTNTTASQQVRWRRRPRP